MRHMKVKVRYYTTLRYLVGNAEEELLMEAGATLAHLIKKVALKYGEKASAYLYHNKEKIDPAIYFLINGANSKILSGFDTKLRDGDVVAIVPPIGGG